MLRRGLTEGNGGYFFCSRRISTRPYPCIPGSGSPLRAYQFRFQHYFRAASLTIARIPAFTGLSRKAQASRKGFQDRMLPHFKMLTKKARKFSRPGGTWKLQSLFCWRCGMAKAFGIGTGVDIAAHKARLGVYTFRALPEPISAWPRPNRGFYLSCEWVGLLSG